PRTHPQRSPEATPPVLSSATALLDKLFEHPAGLRQCGRFPHPLKIEQEKWRIPCQDADLVDFIQVIR
ncbi:MAG: hypothetical protein AAB242_03130, partial [Nitrospirota bacterium]